MAEVFDEFLIIEEFRLEDLDRHVAVQQNVSGLVYDGHPAFANLPQDIISFP